MQEHFPLKLYSEIKCYYSIDWFLSLQLDNIKQSRKIKTLYSRDVGGQYYLFYY